MRSPHASRLADRAVERSHSVMTLEPVDPPSRAEPEAVENSGEGEFRSGFGPPERTVYDGRHARAERTQRAVTEGMLECLEAGDPHPTAKHVAERAGVSVRAVFRHFDRLETLFAAVCELQYDRVLKSLRRVKATGPFSERLAAFVLQQGRLNERISPVRRGAQRYEPVSRAISRCNDRLRQRDREEIGRVFEVELGELPHGEKREAIRALAAISSWSHWEELRRHEHLAAPRARRVVEREIQAVLSGS